MKAAKKKINVAKVKGIHDRKDAFLKEITAREGFKVKPGMITAILNPTTKTADLYYFDAIYDRIDWRSDMAKAGYVRSVKYG